MTELKRKVTLKRKMAAEPHLEKSNKKCWLWLIPALVLMVGGVYFLSKGDDSATDGSTTQELLTGTTTDESVPSETTSTAESTIPEKGTGSTSPVSESVSQSTGQAAEVSQSGTKSATPSIPYKQGEAYKVYQFPFGDGSYSRPNPELDKLAKTLAENPDAKIQIFAYTDKVGSAEFNQTLSTKRAKAIYDYLVSKGIDKGRLSYQGKGISTKYGSDAENRRAEFILK
jgi:outer membrane protein OmpA-like peptidoglycan-associated protein